MTERKKDSLYEGRDRAFTDIDRMVNDGLAGGTVDTRYSKPQIEQAVDFPEEAPPRNCEEEDC